jgi:hypothetical protein
MKLESTDCNFISYHARIRKCFRKVQTDHVCSICMYELAPENLQLYLCHHYSRRYEVIPFSNTISNFSKAQFIQIFLQVCVSYA